METIMTGNQEWVNYSGGAEVVLIVVLAAAAAAVAYAGIRLPLPARPPKPGRAATIIMLAVWVLAIAALLVSVAVYETRVYRAGLAHTARSDPITPVTLIGAAVLFVVIAVAQKGRGWRVAAGSAVIGAAAGPWIFEVPFDLIIMPRTHPLLDPGLYRVVLFGPLVLTGVMTVALLCLSPAVRVQRATLWCLAAMLALFAVWGLFGFSYPSAPGPVTLNTLSKILALVTALTLFLPRRAHARADTPPGSNAQAQPARPPLAVNSPAFTGIADDPQLTSRPARSSVPGRVRPHSRFLAAVLGSALLMALVTAGCSSASTPGGAPGNAGQATRLLWLCRPGQTADPCASNLAASAVTAAGTVTPASWPHSAAASKFACFYVYPTTSLAETGNTGLAVTKEETYAAIEQAAPFSRVCDVWAPVYRSQTFPSVLKGLTGDQKVMRSTFTVAYDSVLPAWQWFLAHTGSKPIILAGDSQGSAVLIHLISAELDHEPSVLHRLLVAVLVGGNLQVPVNKTVGATFTKVPLCTASTQTGCAIAFSSYPSEPPEDSMFGRPGQGVSLQSGQTAKAGQQVACVNPAALGGGTGDLAPYQLTATQTAKFPGDSTRLTEPVSTPWVAYPGLYSATCKQGGGATWLQVTSLAATSRARPVVTEKTVGNYGGGTGPAWGYHGYEYALTLGNLLHDTASEEAAWQSSH
jgi:Protein of unknown function (DUF3089)